MWDSLKEGLQVCYGPTLYDNFFGNLTKLQQQTSVRDYQAQYERLLSRAGKLSEAQQIGEFVSELKESIRTSV
jgi:hypothetical protein